ncbi:MAG: ISL3 family transposase [Acidimicrobiia bacterium]|nr:ISL3 family transposase [Acidimicrobiia bacterium]MYC46385.1 ISL3 family transposase [Acidimicrobiia bacterium]
MGREARPISDVAGELGCDWHTVNRAVLSRGQALLAADAERVGAVEAFGLDETLFGRYGRWRTRVWCTSIVDVTGGQLLDIVPGRDAAAPTAWLLEQPQAWRDGIDWGVLDLSGAYRSAFDTALPHVGQVADPFHVVRLANTSIDEVRRRVQNDTLGHRGRKEDPFYRIRRLLLAAHERLGDAADAKLRGLLAAGDLRGEVRLAWHAKETLRGLYDLDCPQIASAYLTELAEGLTDGDCPPELRRLGRTLGRWHTAIVNWHRARVTNGPTLAINNLVKRVKRAAFGFRRFAHYRIRALLYAGRPNWALLAGLTPR